MLASYREQIVTFHKQENKRKCCELEYCSLNVVKATQQCKNGNDFPLNILLKELSL